MNYWEIGLTRAEKSKLKEETILEIIKTYWKKYNYSPTVREIARKASISSTSTVLKYLNKLQDKGFIEWKEKTPRTIQIIDQQAKSSAI
jgi:repressor LexA